MQPRTCMLSALTLGTAMFLGAAAIAADLPKEGTFSGTYSGFGTDKVTLIGKERLLDAFDENGLTLTNGLLDHATLHCFGLYDAANGMGQWNGRCVITDTAGDQIVADVASDGKFPTDAKSDRGLGTFTTGTGKYAGITGGWTFEGHVPEFRTAVEGTHAQNGPFHGSYKLP